MRIYKKLLPLLGVGVTLAPTVLTSCSNTLCHFVYDKAKDGDLVYDSDLNVVPGKMTEELAFFAFMQDAISKKQLIPNDIAYYKVNLLKNIGLTEEYTFEYIQINLFNIEKDEHEQYLLSFDINGSGWYKSDSEKASLKHHFDLYVKCERLAFSAIWLKKIQDANIWCILPKTFKTWLDEEGSLIPLPDYSTIFQYMSKQEGWDIRFSLNIQNTIVTSATLNNEYIQQIQVGDANELGKWTVQIMSVLSFYSHYLHLIDIDKEIK